ncbi:MAG: LssY C-terminal domain-containing protein [Bauldia sp.]
MRLRRAARFSLWTIVALLTVYAALAYVLLPVLWTHYEQQPALAGRPMITRTADGIPGDPLNVGLVGHERELVEAISAAGWHPADPITVKTSLAIVGSVMFDRPYLRAPVSNLYYEGRKQDFAFEAPAGTSANRRHHVRFWKVLDRGAEGRPVWLGSSAFDTGSGLSSYTGQVTHHISPDVDAERDFFLTSLTKVGMLDRIYAVTGVGPMLNGRNGGGDRYFTDGEVEIGVINKGALPSQEPPDLVPSPLPVELKDQLFDAIGDLLD